MQKYSIQDIEKTFKEKSWWAMIANLTPSKYVTYFIANYTSLTPNQVTLISFILAIISGVAFWFGYFILGAFLYQLSYIFDIVDGSLARIKKISSAYGAFLDVFTDWIKAPLLMVILLYSQNKVELLIVILLLLAWNCCANKYNDMLFYTEKKSLTNSSEVQSSKIGKYFNYMKEKQIIALPGIVEFEALILFLYPITQMNLFIYLSILLLIFMFVLKSYVIYKKVK
jgi:hypothetical protein